MRKINQFFTTVLVTLLLLTSSTVLAQEESPKGPEYYTVTTMFWNPDNDATSDEWKAIEKEYMDKVTKKNEFIMNAGYYTHLFTANSNELMYVQSFANWEAIDKATARSTELEKEAWPDEAVRDAFLDKMNDVYSGYHKDEIFATLEGAKVMKEERSEDMVLYLRQNKWTMPEGGSMEEFEALNKKVTENVIHKNEYIKAYYPSRHAWGSDKRDFNQGIFFDSIDDLGKMFDRNTELFKEALTEEEGKTYGKYIEEHGDYLYTAIKL